MIVYLPEIYPDELVYSWFCRFYVHSGYISHKMALQDILYKECNNPSKEFLGHLNLEMEQMIKQLYSIDELIIKHTMYPQYARFIPLEQKKMALYRIGYDFCDVHHLFTVLPRTGSEQNLRYCPMCVKEDRYIYGEAYWHRKHQIRNMYVCPKHECMLIDSGITAKSDQTFTLFPAETSVKDAEIRYAENHLEIVYTEYLSDIFDAPIDFEKDTPISAVLYHFMSKTKYLKPSGKTRYTRQLADDMNGYYKGIGLNEVASIYQIQRALLGKGFDFSVICQVAFFLGMGVEELAEPVLTHKQIEQERNSHFMKDAKSINWKTYDDEIAPFLEQVASDIYYGKASETGRPERVSERIIYRELGLPEHRLEKLPKCKAIMEKYQESYEENWARRLIWAYQKLKAERKGEEFYWSDIRLISGVKKKNIGRVIPYLEKHTDADTVKRIKELL
jgi:hypothetical protein